MCNKSPPHCIQYRYHITRIGKGKKVIPTEVNASVVFSGYIW